MITFVDTHAHIYSSEFANDINEVIATARGAGVGQIFMPNIDGQSIGPMLELEKTYPDYCMPMMGLHPCYVKEDYREQLAVVETWLSKRSFSAIGEIGLDLYWDKSFIEEQTIAFETQISWAKSLDLPIAIHCRESLDISIDIVRKHQDGKLKGIFHCFSGTSDHALEIIDLGFLLGIGGVATFKNGGLDKVIPEVELKNIVLETDSPYLAPAPYRGKRNSPSYIPIIASKIASFKTCSLEEVAAITTTNASNLFRNGR
jgi:TatD DNase family protein